MAPTDANADASDNNKNNNKHPTGSINTFLKEETFMSTHKHLHKFDVLGIPKPQGSKKAFNANGRAMLKESGGLSHAAWRNAVAEAAQREADTHPDTPHEGPLVVQILYRFPMPLSRPKLIRQLGIAWKTTSPDIDKLDRCINDGLMAGGLIKDDATICVMYSRKVEIANGWAGATIIISAPWTAQETVNL